MTDLDRSEFAPPIASRLAASHNSPKRGSGRGRGPFRLLLNVFSSVWLGITLLTLLFIYSSVGSAGYPTHLNILDPAHWVALRQRPWFEMTEFEWFHWWPFKLIIALICTNLVVATLRRIPFNIINLGVWLIHTGIITLALGSVWYFSTKVEGDAPVNRRRIVIEVPGEPAASIVALPGNSIMVGKGDNAYSLQVQDIDPQWELLSGDDKGTKAYKVSVAIQSKAGPFIRQLLAGYPQYTEDVIRSPDPNAQQPMVRAIKATGKPLVDESLKLSLEYDPQQYFYLMDSRALYLREVGQREWVQRPINNLPRYNDYIAAADDVWQAPGDEPLAPEPIINEVPPSSPNDPLPNTTFRISRYLRYANLETRRFTVPDGPLDPIVRVRITSPQGHSEQYDLAAGDPKENTASNGKLAFVWMNSNTLDVLAQVTEPTLHFTVPGTTIAIDKPIRKVSTKQGDVAFEPIEGSEYSYRVQGVQDGLHINNHVVSVAIIEIRTPRKTFTRWVFDDPHFNRDLAVASGISQHEADIPLDTGLESVYRPGHQPPAPVLIVGGPGEHDLSVVISLTTAQSVHKDVHVGDVIPIAEDITMTVQQYAPRTVSMTKPFVVPREQREREVRENLSMIDLEIPAQGTSQSLWLPYHMFAFAGPEEVLRRFPYQPRTLTLPDGRQIEFMFSRARLPLPAPVALDEFKVASHIGGFTGQNSSIMDWISMLRFEGAQGWTAAAPVSMNKPIEYEGYWFFQAQWDPPDPPRFQGDSGSRGLNYTVLGVGNRNGVAVQLTGACIAVFGMFWAFYIKPIIKRRRQQAVYTQVASRNGQINAGRRTSDQPVGAAAWKAQS